MAIMRISIDGKDRCVRFKKVWNEHGDMYLALTTGEVIKRSLKYFPTDRIGWQSVKLPSPLPNPVVMGADNYFVYCAAYAVSFAPDSKKKDAKDTQRHNVWNLSWASAIVFG